MIEVMLKASFELEDDGATGHFILLSASDDGNQAYGGFGSVTEYWAHSEDERYIDHYIDESRTGHLWCRTYWGVMAEDGEVYFYPDLQKATLRELIDQEMKYAATEWRLRAKKVEREAA